MKQPELWWWIIFLGAAMAQEDNMECTLLTEDVRVEHELLSSGLGAAAAVESASPPPVIDLSLPDAAANLWSAARSVGFFTVINHGIPASLIEETFDAAKEFFEHNRTTKERLAPYSAKLNAGYEFMQQVRPSTGLPDVKESFQITARPDAMVGRWPSGRVEKASKALMDHAKELAATIMTLLELNIPSLQAGTLSKAHTMWTSTSQVTLRMLHYPPLLEPAPPGSMRAGAHTDWDCVTLLFQTPGNEGLECAANPRNNTSSTWVPVDPIVGGIAVNIGDMLARWSDGLLLSNLHRVRMPVDATKGRFSLAYFAQADTDQIITVRDPHSGDLHSITAGHYIQGRIRSNYANK